MLLRYDIAVTGAANVDRALASIERRFAQHNRTVNRMTGGGTSASTSARSANVASSVGAREAREAQKAQGYWQRAHQRAADYRIRQEEKAHAVRLRQIAREESAQKRAADSLDRQRSRALLQKFRAEERESARRAKESAASRAQFARGAVGSIGGATGGTLRTVGALAGSALSIGGGFAMAGAVGAQMADSKRAAMLANQAGNPGLKGNLLAEAQATRGFTTSESLGAVEAFVTKTGDLGAARDAMPMLGDLSLAYGANIAEMGEAAGQAFNVIRDTITDPVEQLKALRDVMSTLAAQGTLGAVEIRDLTRELAGLGAATRKFEGGPTQLLKTMGAMAQASVARGGAASAAEATTAVSRFAADIVKSPAQKALGAMGVNVFSDETRTKLKDPREIMVDILDKTQGDMTKIEEIMNVESAKALGGFSPLFLEAEAANNALPKEQRKKRGDAGRAALMAEFEKFMGAAADPKELEERVASMLDEPSMKFQQVLKDFNTAVGGALLPTIIQLAPKFQEMIPMVDQSVRVFAKLVDAFLQDPITGIGAVIALKVAADLAQAGIGTAAKAALDKAMDAAFGGGEGAAPGGKGAGLLGGASIALAAATVILTAGIVNFEAKEAAIDQMGALVTAARNAKTPEELEKIKREAQKIEEKNQPGFVDKLLGGLSMTTSLTPYYLEEDGGKAERARAAEAVTNSSATQKSFDTMIGTINGEFKRVAAEQMAAAKAQKEAAEHLKASNPNRGNAPSPVKNSPGS